MPMWFHKEIWSAHVVCVKWWFFIQFTQLIKHSFLSRVVVAWNSYLSINSRRSRNVVVIYGYITILAIHTAVVFTFVIRLDSLVLGSSVLEPDFNLKDTARLYFLRLQNEGSNSFLKHTTYVHRTFKFNKM